MDKIKRVTNKDVIQSYIFTTARYNYNVHEKRILYRIIELAQADLEGKKLDGRYTTTDTIFNNLRKVVMPASLLLNNDEDKNYHCIKKALKSLRDKSFEYVDEKGNWKVIGVIEVPEFEKYSSYINFHIHKEVWEVALNFAKGFRKYELKTAMKFEGIYSMRFYELLTGQKLPITYSIKNLKIMFKIEDKYKLVADFIRFVIIPAKIELDKSSPYSFEYQLLKTGRKITSIQFFPYEIPANRDNNLEKMQLHKKINLSWDLDKIVVNYLKDNFDFSSEEIKRNIDLLSLANEKLDLLAELSNLKSKAFRANNGPKPYIIGSLQKIINSEITKGKK